MKLIVDTNIVFSTILNSQSWIGQILLHPDDTLIFFSPLFLRKEILNHKHKIKQRTNLSEVELDELIDLVYSKIQFIDEKLIPKEIFKIADQLTREIDFDDAVFIALAIHQNCKLWTGDKNS
ncbi:PIN domain-containing protein [Tangfeifania diversioriginum]|uniref:PIN domain-containing protein n=1 Tax=Tangfeifania diversioriginum TaxID=1168035 RepID=A0A1M6N493_9BACT|nr:PIN domain-containing protein [Tangfeifania diversioriginum]SHJ90510.1 PIN domain-containing protein [Tangfeifania diversioriginum]